MTILHNIVHGETIRSGVSGSRGGVRVAGAGMFEILSFGRSLGKLLRHQSLILITVALYFLNVDFAKVDV